MATSVVVDKKLLRFTTVRTPDRIAKAAKILRKHHLYLNGGEMFRWTDYYNIYCIKAFTIVTYQDEPIAAGIRYITQWRIDVNTGIFVKAAYRRQGIGSEVLKRLKLPNVKFTVGEGLTASVPFYSKHQRRFKLNLTFTPSPEYS